MRRRDLLLVLAAASTQAAGRQKSTPVLDREGRTVAWIRDDLVVGERAIPLLRIRDNTVYDWDGAVGHFVDGIFRDLGGRAVAFVAGASGKGLSLPAPKASRAEPPVSGRPGPPAITKRWPASPRAQWSELSWEEFAKADQGRRP